MEDPTSSSTSTTPPRILYAFDFDHTIVEGNSDTAVVKVIDIPLPAEMEAFYRGQSCLEMSWINYMNDVFSFLHQNGVTVEMMEEFVRKMTPTKGMVSLLQEIQSRKSTSDSKLLVISDANDVFINAFLSSIGVVADYVITNKSIISATGGPFQIQAYEDQESCAICPRNLCKGTALLAQLMKEKTAFSSIIYVGDGRNDVCPGMTLSTGDFLFVRQGYGLEKILKRGSVQGIRKRQESEDGGHERGQEIEILVDIKAQIHFWEDAATIRDVIFGGSGSATSTKDVNTAE